MATDTQATHERNAGRLAQHVRVSQQRYQTNHAETDQHCAQHMMQKQRRTAWQENPGA